MGALFGMKYDLCTDFVILYSEIGEISSFLCLNLLIT